MTPQLDGFENALRPKRPTPQTAHVPNSILFDQYILFTASFERMSQRWRVFGNTVFDLTGPRLEPQFSRSKNECFTAWPTVRWKRFIYSNQETAAREKRKMSPRQKTNSLQIPTLKTRSTLCVKLCAYERIFSSY